MKLTIKMVREQLAERAEKEWRDLISLEHNLVRGDVSITEALVDAQRARWAAWDAAAEIAMGEAVTSHETAQRSR